MDIIVVSGIILLATFIAWLIIAKKKSRNIFKCKFCLKEFNPKWTKLIFVTHYDNEYNIECPYCNKKGCLEKSDSK